MNIRIPAFITSFITTMLASSPLMASEELTPIYEIAESSGIYLQAPLPHDIYRYSQSSQLKDVVVIDRDGNSLPSRIVTAEQIVSGEGERFPLTFFPVTAGPEPGSWIVQGNTRVQIDEKAIAISLEGEGDSSRTAASRFYLIDLRNQEQTIENLELNWTGDEFSQFLPVEVSGTNDLQHWTELARDTLAQLTKDGQTLLRNQIPLKLPPDRYDYLRIRFPSKGQAQLTEVHGHEPKPVQTVPPVRWQVQGHRARDQDPVIRAARAITAWEYQRDDKAPAQKIAIHLDQIIYGDTVRIYSRANNRRDWRLQHSGVWFNARVGDEWQRSDPAGIYPNSDPHWRLELSGEFRDSLKPELVFQHPRENLRFIANNNGPYRIAVVDEVPARRSAERVLGEVLGVDQVEWEEVEIEQLRGLDQHARTETGYNWTGILFWATLVTAVVMLVGFAVRLYRQLGHHS